MAAVAHQRPPPDMTLVRRAQSCDRRLRERRAAVRFGAQVAMDTVSDLASHCFVALRSTLKRPMLFVRAGAPRGVCPPALSRARRWCGPRG